MPEVKIVSKDEKDFLRVEISHFSQNSLEEVNGIKTFMMNRSVFIQSINETLDRWHLIDWLGHCQMISEYRTMSEIMQNIIIDNEYSVQKKQDIFVPIRLIGNVVVTYSHDKIKVLIPVDLFVISALTYLSKNPYLYTGDHVWDFRIEMMKKWNETEKKLDMKELDKIAN